MSLRAYGLGIIAAFLSFGTLQAADQSEHLLHAAQEAPNSAPIGGPGVAHLVFEDPYWQLALFDAQHNKSRTITRSDGDKRRPVWLAGLGLAFINDRAEAKRLVDGAGSKDLLAGRDVESIAALDGKGDLLAAVFENTRRDVSHIWRCRVGTHNHECRKLTRGNELHRSPAALSDGSGFFFVTIPEPFQAAIQRFDFATGETAPVIADGYQNIDPAPSPDGQSLAYASNLAGNYDIWLMDVNGGTSRQLTNSPDVDTEPRWSLDGRQLWFTSNRGGKLGIWSIDVVSGEVAALIAGAGPVRSAAPLGHRGYGETPQ